MAAEIEGAIQRSNYKQRRSEQLLREREAEIKALKSLLEETKRAAEEKIEALEKSVKYYRHHTPQKRKARAKKAPVETQGQQETAADEDSAGTAPFSIGE